MRADLRLIDRKRYFSSTDREFMLQSLRYFDKTIHTMSGLEWEMNYSQECSSIEDLRKWSYNIEYSFRSEVMLWLLGMLAKLKVPWVMKLKEVDFHYNLMRVIPENIGNLSHIEHLDLSNNKLQFLPESFSQLTNLKTLKLQFNQFEGFPNQIFACIKLKKLWIFANYLKELPSSILELTQLEEINVSCMGLQSIPEIEPLQQLKHLNLNSNRISSLPTLPPSIQYLMVQSNHLSALPTFKGNTSLIELHAQNNPISSLPHLPISLEYLNVEHTELDEQEIHKRKIPSFFTGAPYTGIRKHAIDRNNASIFDSLFTFFPLAHSALKRSGINIICDESMRRSCFRKNLDENHTIQKQAFLDRYPDFLNQEKTYFIFYARLRGRTQYTHLFEQDPQLFGFFFPYEGGMDFFHKGGRIGTSGWEEGYHALMDWLLNITDQSKTQRF